MTLGGTAWLLLVAQVGTDGLLVPGILTAAGGAALVGSLAWLAWRGIRARRHLDARRYRGPSVVLLFVLAVAAGNVLPLPFLVADVLAGNEPTEPGLLATTVLLLMTPSIFIAVAALFVVQPGALAGVRFGDGPRTAWNVGRGIALGAGAWVAAAVVGAAVAWIVGQLTGQEPTDNQVVAGLATSLPPVVAVALIGLLAPFAEELFFRWVAVNAWERERGTRVAILGSATLFGAAHVLGGSLWVLPSIFLLGVILAGAYVATRSLPLVVGLHATFNCLSLAVLFLVGT
ncbi:MAG TPA: CPBP family intramembrane glutamic endopeptidase [Candidatus Limnocylindria bacterium]